jgi:hypothetical protein
VIGADANGDIQLTADGSGVVQLFLSNAFASDTGFVRGQIIAELPPPYGTSRTPALVYAATTYHIPVQFLRAGIGPSLQYAVVVADSAGRPVPGARVAFRRTGGIGVTPASFAAVADASGRLVLPTVPSAAGTLLGTVTITAAGLKSTTFSVSIPTFDSDDTPVLGTWRAGNPSS